MDLIYSSDNESLMIPKGVIQDATSIYKLRQIRTIALGVKTLSFRTWSMLSFLKIKELLIKRNTKHTTLKKTLVLPSTVKVKTQREPYKALNKAQQQSSKIKPAADYAEHILQIT